MKTFDQLSLSPEQQEAIKKIHDEERVETEPLGRQIHDIKKEMFKEWASEPLDEKKIIALQERAHALKGQLEILHIESRVDMLAVLTAEQRAQLALLKAEHRTSGKGKRKRFGKKKGHGRGYSQGMSVDPSLDSRSHF